MSRPVLDPSPVGFPLSLSTFPGISTGGYIPSSSAADDYLNNLKADSKRKHKEQQARLRGGLTSEEEPPATASAAPNQVRDLVRACIVFFRVTLYTGGFHIAPTRNKLSLCDGGVATCR